ncbi:NADP-dependent oxidoreductase domain-containing protein [Apiospora phragmitis]|uniref:NADP-dependent oxidoreductase domain-containing protein n=1 Tax=Apiospora phragmitis TaxID=2905665 RepID=A0ABR1WV46_9PEZI
MDTQTSNIASPATETPPPPPKPSCGLTQDLTLPSSSSPWVTTTPRLIYGTAWKKDATADLVYQALKCGFRGIDTAAQPRHYQERLVGDGVRRAVAEGIVTREELYLQTKFTSVHGQDPDDLPYDPAAPLQEQVKASVASSLRNLCIPSAASLSQQTGDDHTYNNAALSSTYLDCVVLHSPLPTLEETVAVWQALEAYVPDRIRHLGIANASPGIVEHLLLPPEEAQGTPEWAVGVRPSVAQNRFHRETGHDLVKKSAVVSDLVARVPGVSRETAFYALVLGLRGTSVLDGTTSEEHMRADLEGIKQIERWADGKGRQMWEDQLQCFKRLIQEV